MTALGIGAAVSVFSVVDAVFCALCPTLTPKIFLYLYTPNSHYTGLPSEIPPNVPDVYDWQRLSRTISSFAMFMPWNSRLVQGDNVTPIATAGVSADFFKTLDVKPLLGRTFNANDDQPGHELVAIISHELWVSHFNARPNILGGKIQLNRKTYTVIGVTASDFRFHSMVMFPISELALGKPISGFRSLTVSSKKPIAAVIPTAPKSSVASNRARHQVRLNPNSTPSNLI